tara:strand:- start:289 stop:510 length:222 start_codon:yes stop_codon:yes gene_type:complete
MIDLETIEPHERNSATIKIKCGDVLIIADKTYYAIYNSNNKIQNKGYCIVDETEYKIWKQWNNYYNDCDNGKI